MSEEIDDQEIDDQPEQSARNSDTHTFLGEDIQPWNFRRKSAAEVLGFRCGRVPKEDWYEVENPVWERRTELSEKQDKTPEEEDEWEKIKDAPKSSSLYQGVSLDAAILVYLCTSSDSQVKRARRSPHLYEDTIDNFAEEKEIYPGGKNFAEAVTLLFTIMGEVFAVKGEPELDKKGDPGPLV